MGDHDMDESLYEVTFSGEIQQATRDSGKQQRYLANSSGELLPASTIEEL